jgi:DNA-binding NarL/FixJ family response regulator
MSKPVTISNNTLPLPSSNYQDEFGPIAITTSNKSTRDYTPTKTSIELLSTHTNKSTAIRYLKEEGKTTSEIADLLNIRYQHVRNVLNQIIKKK